MPDNLYPIYVFVDESGDLGRLGSKFFSIVCLSTSDEISIGRIIKKARQRKLRKSIKQLPELKGNNSGDDVRKFILNRIAKADCAIDVIVIPKNKIRDYLYAYKHRLYNYFFGLLLENMSLPNKNIFLVIDKKDSNKLLREDFDRYATKKLSEQKFNIKIEIKHAASHSDSCLQATDFVAWAVNRKYSFEDDSYFKIIEPKIRTIKHLWQG